jgi:hypothetical protein
MNTLFIPFTQAAATVIKAPNDRSKIIAVAVAYAISRCLPMPTTEHGDPTTYFTSNLLQSTRDTVSLFNEEILFDTRIACDMARSFWMMRHAAAFPDQTPMYNTTYGFFDSVVSVANFFSPEMHCFANQYKEEIFALANVAWSLIKQEA